ncbi:MAG TPA: hypothetical protein VF552_04250 [Allosphingosinicella sp.]|jgi:hypothetical protein
MRRDRDKWKPDTWRSSHLRGKTLAEDLDLLLADLCRQWGFCSASAWDIAEDHDVLTPDAFATVVLGAEGWPEPEKAWAWRVELTKVFSARYGSRISPKDYDHSLRRTSAFHPRH